MGTQEEHPEKMRHQEKQNPALKEKTNNDAEDFELGDEIYQSIFDTLPFGCSLNKIQYDANNKPATFTILKVNQAFEKAIGTEGTQLQGKPAYEVFNKLNRKWISKFATVAKSGKKKEFTEFTFDGNSFFDIRIHSPKPWIKG